MRKLFFVSLVTMLSASLYAGGSQEADTAEVENSWSWVINVGDFVEVDALKVDGTIITAGSSTVFPAAEFLATQFQDEGFSGNITIDSIGSGAGFERFTKGETDISNASRPIKGKEVDAAKSIGRNPIEFHIGTDALAVVVNTTNDWIKNASLVELAAIMTAEKWSDVNADWPNKTILKFIPGTDSGTFDYFVEEVFDKDPEPLLVAPNIQLSEDDNILVQGIEGSPYSIGFFGYAYYAEEGDALTILNIEGVEATTATVDAGEYPLARPLFMYSDAEIMRNKPQVAAYLAYVLNNANDAMEAVGYFKAPESAISGAKKSWMEAVGAEF